MRTLLGALLSVITIGVLLIAYGVLSPKMATADSYQGAPAMFAGDRIVDSNVSATPSLQLRCEPGQRAVVRQVAGAAAAECVDDIYGSARASLARPANDYRTVALSQGYPEPRPVSPVRTVRSSRRDWTKTAMVIGGSSATGAGIGGILGGKKGALIGAAIGGGAGTLFEVGHR